MRELTDKRTRFSKTFDLGGGRRRLEIGQQPMHFERDGALHDVDLTPKLDRRRKLHLVKDCAYALRIADDRPAYYYNSPSGKQVEVELLGAVGKPISEGGLLKWPEVGKDTDYVIQPLPAGCSTLLFLHSPEAPRKWSWRVSGDLGLILPLSGRDAAGRRLELIERRDPKSGTIEVEWTGRATSLGGLRREKRVSWSEEVSWPVAIDPTVNESITAGADDAYSIWVASGASFYYFGGTGAALGVGRYASVRLYAGLRFQTVSVTQGATINSATLTVRVATVQGSPNINIYGNDVDDAAAWSDPANRVKNIAKTSAVANLASWVNDADNAIDVATVVSEIVARAGWAAGNDMAFGFFDNGAGSATDRAIFAALEHPSLTEARLTIDYSDAGAEVITTAMSASGSGTLAAIGASQAAATVSAAGAGAVTSVGSSVASAALSAVGSTGRQAALSAAGSGTVSAVAASIASADVAAAGAGAATFASAAAGTIQTAVSAAGTGAATFASASVAVAEAVLSASGAGGAAFEAADEGLVITPDAPANIPAGGGGGFGPTPPHDRKRFRIRKEKSKPKVITVRIGDWPEDPQIILERRERAEREEFHRSLIERPFEAPVESIDDEEEILLTILALAA